MSKKRRKKQPTIHEAKLFSQTSEISDPKDLCLSLLFSDTEEEVINLLKEANYWDNDKVWRFYGDRESNFNTIGNQQSRPEAALVEKLVNSVDARLMNECLIQSIKPDSDEAPTSIKEAVARFFDENPSSETAGLIREWTDKKRKEVAEKITLAATGAMPTDGNPCYTISDLGEGQTPMEMPKTILSLDRTNKLRIPFVQGKFNMGGTGALKFCGKNNLQLVISRRNPNLLNNPASLTDQNWGFSIVRREDPSEGRRSSVYTYLAPINVESKPKQGDIISFSAKEMPIFPTVSSAYGRSAEWGTLIKLYEYDATGFKSHILMGYCLLSRVGLLLPDVALPIRFYECRPYGGHKGSLETTLTGLRVRLDDDRSENLEEGFPTDSPMSVCGEQMIATIYAFKKGRAKTYHGNEGIIFSLNGQTHGFLTTAFFSRTNLALSYLSDSLVVIVDCSKFSGRAREDLFMNSRDRLSHGELRVEIEKAIEEVLKQNQLLRELKTKRRSEEIESQIEDSRPLVELLKSVLKKSPTLSSLFLKGQVNIPFKQQIGGEDIVFKGKKYPSFFKFKKLPYGEKLIRDCHLNTRARLIFETDVVNDYFNRRVDPGDFKLCQREGNVDNLVKDFTLNLHNGTAILNLKLPNGTKKGDSFEFVSSVTSNDKISPFVNEFAIKVIEAAVLQSGSSGQRRKPPSKQGNKQTFPSGIAIPNIIYVYENKQNGSRLWEEMTPQPFDKYSALRIKQASSKEEEKEIDADVYDFFINMDNVFLKSEQKTSKQEPKILESRFANALVLIGLALIQQETTLKFSQTHKDESSEDNITQTLEERVEDLSKAIAMVILPMIEQLGALDSEAILMDNLVGEAV